MKWEKIKLFRYIYYTFIYLNYLVFGRHSKIDIEKSDRFIKIKMCHPRTSTKGKCKKRR